MKKVLYIKANPKSSEASSSLKVADALAKKYTNEGKTVVELDLYKEGINHVDGEILGKLFSGQENEITKYVNDFITYDEYIFAAPMWNLSIPSILKTYIDHILVAGKTFAYTATGPVGLLENKKAVHVTSRGGFYNEGPAASYEMGDRYMKTILGFIGITDVSTISIEGASILTPEDLEKNINSTIESL